MQVKSVDLLFTKSTPSTQSTVYDVGFDVDICVTVDVGVTNGVDDIIV